MKKVLLLIAGMMVGMSVWGQSYIGLDGGLEGSATVDNSTTYAGAQTGKWAKANATQTISLETSIVRSGSNSLKTNNSNSTGRRVWSPNFTISSTTTNVTIQYYRQVSSTANTSENQEGIQNNTEGLQGTYDVPASANSWEKQTYTKSSSTFTSISGVILARLKGTGGDLIIDDMAIYAGSVDNSAPLSPGAITVNNPTINSLDLSWGAASGGVDGGGYFVVRYASNPGANDDPNINGIYAVGNTVSGSVNGTVIYVGTNTTFTDNSGLSSSTTYYYKVYTVDKAFNYSGEVTGNGTTSSSTPSVNFSADLNSGSEAGTTVVTLTATSSAPVAGDQTVDVAVTGTGITGGDYTLGATSITILSGATTGTTTFTVVDDAAIEGSETATVTISNPSSGLVLGATLSQNIAITDNDANNVNLSADVNSGTEAGTTVVTLTATASTAVTGDQTVDVAVSGTGITAGDYSLSATSITILNGNTTGTVTFTIVDDAAIEGAETATVTISNPSGGIALGSTFSQNIAITDNDFATTVQFTSASGSVSEGVGTTNLTLSIANPSASTATTVDVALTGGTGSAADINTYTTQTVTFPANTSGDQTVTLTVTDDALVEGSETFIFTLQNVSGGNSAALGAQTTFTQTITDNDFNAVTLNTVNVPVTQDFNTLANTGTSSTLPTGWLLNEVGTGANSTYSAGNGSGNGGETYSYGSTSASDRAFGTLLSGSVTSTVGASVRNNTGSTITTLRIAYTGEQWRLGATGRTDQLDFQYSTDASSLSTGTWTDVNSLDFISPVTTGTVGPLDGNTAPNKSAISFDITGLSISSGSTFYIRWNDANATGSDDGLGVDDFSINANPTPTISLSATANAGTEVDQTVITLTATASSAVSGSQTVDLAVTGTGIDGGDYSLGAATITIADGATTGTTTFTVTDDAAVEGAETATVTISNPSSGISLGATVSQNIAITDNDFATTVQFGSATSSVAESGGTTDLTLSIANPSGSVATTVEVAITGGTGSASDINTYTTQTVTFPAGSSTSETVTLTVTDDAVMEGNETLVFSLQNVSGGNSAALGAQTSHTLTITDNDNASITLSGSATESSENGAVITVNLTNDTFEPSLTTGNWAVTNLPAGVTKGTLNRVSDTQATIALTGTRTTDFDTNFSPIVTIDHAELVTTASGSVTANSGFTFTATDDAESITVAGDGSITEGSEAGEILTVTVVGGTVSSTFSQAAWTLNNLPSGLTKGTVTQVDETHVTIAISGTATDYDTNANVSVSVSQDQIDDYSGADLASTNNVVFTAVTEAVPAGFFSEYVEGSSNNKAIEIYNNSGSTIDFTAGSYKVELYTNGSATVSTTLNLTGTLAPNDVYVIVNASAGAGLLALGDITSGVTGFNGDDALVLKSGSTILDVIGQIGTDPGTQWISGGVSTLDKTLRRKITVTTGDSNGSNVFDPSVEWDVYNIDTFSDLGFPPSQTNPTSGSFSNVTVTGSTTLVGNLTVSGTLTISGASLSTGSNSVNLGATGSLTGETTTNYILGTVTANPTLSGSSPVSIAGMGLTINPNGNNLGSTSVTRRTGAAASVLGVGLNRLWTITPTSQPSGAVNVTITWPAADDNGLDLNSLLIYKSDDNGATWQMHAGPLSTATDPRSLSFTTTSFSDWTVGDLDSPLPVDLLSVTVIPGNKRVTLNWETTSELNHEGFEIYRSRNNKENFRLFKSYKSVNELRPKGNTGGKYFIVDQEVINSETYFYKLVDVSLDGKRKVQAEVSAIPTDGKPVVPGFEQPIQFEISSIYPNPFNPTTNLLFNLPGDGLVVIRLYNVIGQEVKVIRNEIMKKGSEQVVTITTDGLPSGVYMVSVEYGGQRLTKRLTFLK